MKLLVTNFLVAAFSLFPLHGLAGESSSGHPFPAPRAFTVIFHDVEPTASALLKYADDISSIEDVLALNMAHSSLVAFHKLVIPLTKKLLTAEPEKRLFTICAHLTNIEMDPFKKPTYSKTYAKVMSGIRRNHVRVVETSSCQIEEIQQVYSETQWADSDPVDEDTTTKAIPKR